MRPEDRAAQGAGLEQREAEDNRVRRDGEQRGVDVGGNNHVVNQHRIDADAHHNQEALERQRKQAFQVVRADASPLTVAHGCYRDRGNADGAVYLNHAPVQDDRNQDGHDFEAQADNQRFNGKPQKLTHAHRLHTRPHGGKRGSYVDVGAAADEASRAGYDVLPDVENRHNDVKGICYEVDRHKRLEEPLEKHPSVYVVEIVPLGYHGNQLVTQHKGDNDPSDGDYHAFG